MLGLEPLLLKTNKQTPALKSVEKKTMRNRESNVKKRKKEKPDVGPAASLVFRMVKGWDGARRRLQMAAMCRAGGTALCRAHIPTSGFVGLFFLLKASPIGLRTPSLKLSPPALGCGCSAPGDAQSLLASPGSPRGSPQHENPQPPDAKTLPPASFLLGHSSLKPLQNKHPWLSPPPPSHHPHRSPAIPPLR